MSRLNRFLQGVRVLDLSRHLPGPLATLLLADMGAEVLKIEPPAGDELRQIGPRGAKGRSVYFDAVSAGKTTRRMNLKRADVRAEFFELVQTSDVLIESFRPGVMARLGVGYEVLTSINPRLIYCSVSGFGPSGPLAGAAAHDVNFLALSGALYDHGGPEMPRVDLPVADYAGGLLAALAIVGALCGRARDGKGCQIDLALADAVMPAQLFQLAELGLTGVPPQVRTGLLNGGAACYQVYDTADGGRVSLAALEGKFWEAFCGAASRPDWAGRHAEPLPQRRLIADVASMFRQLTLAECEKRFGAADCCVAPVLNLSEAIQSPHVRGRGLVHRTNAGELQALFPAVVDGEPPAPRRAVRDDEAG